MLEKYKDKIIAHRGIYDNIHTPENSLNAFKKALKKELPIELDVHLLKDNTLVVFHDSSLKRMTNIDKGIKDLTYEDIKKINLLDSDNKIPTLEETLDLISGKVPVIIELKNDGRVKDLGKTISGLLDNYKGEFIIQSFYPNILNWFKKNKPEYIRGLLISNKYPNRLFKLLSKSCLLLNYTKPNFLSVSKKILNTPRINKLRDSGIPIFCWTIKNEQELNEAKSKAYSIISKIDK